MANFLVKQGLSADAIAAGGQTGRVVIHVDATNTFIVVGNAATSNLSVGTENVASATITKIFFSGNTTVARGSNTVFSATTGSAGVWDLTKHDVVLNQYNTANVVVTIGTGGGPAIIELRKKLV